MKKSAFAFGLAIFVLASLAAAKASESFSAFPAQPEIVRGSLSNVNLDQRLIVVTTPDHVTYDFKLADARSIKLGDHAIKLDQLTNQIGKQAVVDYRPLRRGDMALKIAIQ